MHLVAIVLTDLTGLLCGSAKSNWMVSVLKLGYKCWGSAPLHCTLLGSIPISLFCTARSFPGEILVRAVDHRQESLPSVLWLCWVVLLCAIIVTKLLIMDMVMMTHVAGEWCTVTWCVATYLPACLPALDGQRLQLALYCLRIAYWLVAHLCSLVWASCHHECHVVPTCLLYKRCSVGVSEC